MAAVLGAAPLGFELVTGDLGTISVAVLGAPVGTAATAVWRLAPGSVPAPSLLGALAPRMLVGVDSEEHAL